jgi:hypothetical protein
MNTRYSRHAAQVVLYLTICSIIPCRATEGAFEREFADGSRLSVLIQEAHFSPDSPEAEILAETTRDSLAKQVGAEEAAKISIPSFLGWRRLVAKLQSPTNSSWTAMWTNEVHILAKASPRLSLSVPLDAIKIGDGIFLAYRSGPMICIEQITGRLQRDARMRFQLARDSSSGVLWTNAAFIVETNGSILLTAHGTSDSTLTWEFRNDEWRLDLPRSKPDSVREMSYREWCLVSHEEGRWTVKRKHTEPMPKLEP